MVNILVQKLFTALMFLMIQIATKNLNLVWHINPLKKGTQTIQGSLNMETIRIAPN